MNDTTTLHWHKLTTVERALKILGGAEYVQGLTSLQCEVLAHGAWLANERDNHVAYLTIANAKRLQADESLLP